MARKKSIKNKRKKAKAKIKEDNKPIETHEPANTALDIEDAIVVSEVKNPTTQNNSVETIEPSMVSSKDSSDKKSKSGKNFLFLVIWIYFFIRIFITDVDLLIFKSLIRITTVDYILIRGVSFLLILLITWYKIKNKRFWKNVGAFFLFPFYPGIWNVIKSIVYTIPKWLIINRQNYLLYVYAEKIIGFFAKFKLKLINFTLFASAIYITLFSDNNILLAIGITLLFYLQLHHLKIRWDELIGPVKVFQLELGKIQDKPTDSDFEKVENQIREAIIKANKDKKDIIVHELEQYVLYSEFLNIFDAKLKRILSSQVYLINFINKSLYSFVYAIFIFGCINYNLFKINSLNYTYEGAPKLFEFMYYSFFNIFSEGVDIDPATRLSKVARMIGVSIGVIINFMILAVYFTVNTSRYKENLEGISLWAGTFSKRMDSQMQEKFKKDTTESKSWLKEQGSNIIEEVKKLRAFFGEK